MTKDPHPKCPRCASDETRRLRNYGRAMGNQFWCTSCSHRWEPCAECNGLTIEFRGKDLDQEYKICSRYLEPGHLSKEQLSQRFRANLIAVRPSGRFG